jgi:hypothetical protein
MGNPNALSAAFGTMGGGDRRVKGDGEGRVRGLGHGRVDLEQAKRVPDGTLGLSARDALAQAGSREFAVIPGREDLPAQVEALRADP